MSAAKAYVLFMVVMTVLGASFTVGCLIGNEKALGIPKITGDLANEFESGTLITIVRSELPEFKPLNENDSTKPGTKLVIVRIENGVIKVFETIQDYDPGTYVVAAIGDKRVLLSR